VNNNLVEGRPAGAVDLGGSAQAASAGYPVGAIHFGPAWEDDSVQLTHKGWSQITDGMAKSIVRLECEAEELRAEVALLQEQARILAEERNEAREDAKRATYDAAQETIKVSTAKSHWIEACCERDHWKSESLEQAKLLAMSADREERLARERDEARMQYRTTELLGMELVKTVDQLKAEKAAIFAQLVSLQAGSRRATLDEIAESVREKYDERHEGEGMEND
jgi:multidrug efflux pump subunit AcrA (membrane-fusion protein)